MTRDTAFISENVIPAIMPDDFERLTSEMRQFVSLIPLVQIDVMDGKLTESKSWPYISGVDADFLKIVNQEEGFPFWDELDIEVDLMVKDPANITDQWIAAGASRIIVHYESSTPEVIIGVLRSIKEKGIETGLAVGLETSPEVLKSFYADNKDLINEVQFMGIRNIGFQGQPFDEMVIENIKKFRESFTETIISVDGGVNEHSAPLLKKAGVNRLVIGSALSSGESLKKDLEYFNLIS